VFEPVVVGVQAQTDDAKNQHLPQVHPGASGSFFAGENFLFQQREDGRLEFGMRPDPLQSGEDGRQFIAAFAREDDLLDGREVQSGSGVESLAHIRECWLFLGAGRTKRPPISGSSPKIRRTFATIIQYIYL